MLRINHSYPYFQTDNGFPPTRSELPSGTQTKSLIRVLLILQVHYFVSLFLLCSSRLISIDSGLYLLIYECRKTRTTVRCAQQFGGYWTVAREMGSYF
jgi:hypothetical protein